MNPNTGESFKGGVHAVLGGLAATCCLYNLLAYSQRKDSRLAVNVVVYAALWGWEQAQTHRHWSVSNGTP